MGSGPNYLLIVNVLALQALLNFPGSCKTRYYYNSCQPQLYTGVWEQESFYHPNIQSQHLCVLDIRWEGSNYVPTDCHSFYSMRFLKVPNTGYYSKSWQLQFHTSVLEREGFYCPNIQSQHLCVIEIRWKGVPTTYRLSLFLLYKFR